MKRLIHASAASWSPLLVALVLAARISSAQGTAHPSATRPSDTVTADGASGDPVAHMVPGLFRGLTLTDAQKKSSDSVLAYYQWQVAKVNGMNQRLKRLALRHQEVDDLRLILTPEQEPTFDKNREEIRAKAMAPQ